MGVEDWINRIGETCVVVPEYPDAKAVWILHSLGVHCQGTPGECAWIRVMLNSVNCQNLIVIVCVDPWTSQMGKQNQGLRTR